MVWSLLASHGTGFTDTSGPGHTYTFNGAGAPSPGDLDILCVNSDTVIATPTGFTSRVAAVNSQGSYIFSRHAAGGEPASVVISGSPDSDTSLVWSRWSGSGVFSSSGSAQANGSPGTTGPALSTGTLAEAGMLVVAFVALHGAAGGLVSNPVWGNGFTPVAAGSSGIGGSTTAAAGLVGYKAGVGTGAESADSVSWTNNWSDRYTLYAAFTGSGAVTLTGDTADTVTAADTAGRGVAAARGAADSAAAADTPTRGILVPRAAGDTLSLAGAAGRLTTVRVGATDGVGCAATTTAHVVLAAAAAAAVAAGDTPTAAWSAVRPVADQAAAGDTPGRGLVLVRGTAGAVGFTDRVVGPVPALHAAAHTVRETTPPTTVRRTA